MDRTVTTPTMKRRSACLDVFPVVFLVGYTIFIALVMVFYIIGDDPADTNTKKQRKMIAISAMGKKSTCDWAKTYMTDESYDKHLKWRTKLIEDRCDLCKQSKNQTNIMEDLCTFTKNITNWSFEHIMVDEKMKIMYCVVPKTACSNWKRVLVKQRNSSLSADFNIHRKNDVRSIGLKYLYEYPTEQREEMIKDYFKFMFVRNPFDRLVSAYRDKFTRNITWSLYFQRKYGQSIISMFRPNDTKAWETGAGVKFEEFIRYIIKVQKKGRKLNAHWTPYTELCQPCHIKYDFIGKFESLDKDAYWALRKMGQKCPPAFPKKNINPKLPPASIMQYYRRLKEPDLSQLYEMFQSDFDFFGYEVQRVPRTGQIIV